MKCSSEMIEAAARDQLDQALRDRLQHHLNQCESCRSQLDQSTAESSWWQDASRFLDETVLSDPESDVNDSSEHGARIFEDDDPVGELKAIGAIAPSSHPEMLGKLGRYTVEREIGSGGMGVVLKAHDAELSRTVAIKVLAPHLARSGTARQRFIREGRAAAAVVHDNIVAIHEVDSSGKLPMLVMRYVDGISLQRCVDLYGPLSIRDALRIASQSASGLAAAHRQGIIHRDVKPANILVNHSCNRAWISDFGLARAVDDASLTRTGFIAGTPHYMSPEQARGGDVGPSSDLFSLGAVIYFMLSGRPPWRAERSLAVLHRIVQHEHRPLWKLNPDVPRKVSDLVDRLLSKRVSERPESAIAVGHELERALSELQNPALASERNDGIVTANRPRWYARPWFVAPATAAITLAAIWYSGPVFRAAPDRAQIIEGTPGLPDQLVAPVPLAGRAADAGFGSRATALRSVPEQRGNWIRERPQTPPVSEGWGVKNPVRDPDANALRSPEPAEFARSEPARTEDLRLNRERQITENSTSMELPGSTSLSFPRNSPVETSFEPARALGEPAELPFSQRSAQPFQNRDDALAQNPTSPNFAPSSSATFAPPSVSSVTESFPEDRANASENRANWPESPLTLYSVDGIWPAIQQDILDLEFMLQDAESMVGLLDENGHGTSDAPILNSTPINQSY